MSLEGQWYFAKNSRLVPDEPVLGNGSHNDFIGLKALSDSVQDAGGGTIYFSPGTYRIESAVTFHENITLVFDPGAQLLPIGDGYETVIHGYVQAGPYRIFGGEEWRGVRGDTRQVRAPLKNGVLYPQWWGAASGVAESTMVTMNRVGGTPPNTVWQFERITPTTLSIQACVNAADAARLERGGRLGQTIKFRGTFTVTEVHLKEGLTYDGLGAVIRQASSEVLPELEATADLGSIARLANELRVVLHLHRNSQVVQRRFGGSIGLALHGGSFQFRRNDSAIAKDTTHQSIPGNALEIPLDTAEAVRTLLIALKNDFNGHISAQDLHKGDISDQVITANLDDNETDLARLSEFANEIRSKFDFHRGELDPGELDPQSNWHQADSTPVFNELSARLRSFNVPPAPLDIGNVRGVAGGLGDFIQVLPESDIRLDLISLQSVIEASMKLSLKPDLSGQMIGPNRLRIECDLNGLVSVDDRNNRIISCLNEAVINEAVALEDYENRVGPRLTHNGQFNLGRCFTTQTYDQPLKTSSLFSIFGFNFDMNLSSLIDDGDRRGFEKFQMEFMSGVFMGAQRGKALINLQGCFIHNSGGDGFSVAGNALAQISDCQTVNCFRGGLTLTGSATTDAMVQNLTTEGRNIARGDVFLSSGIDIELDGAVPSRFLGENIHLRDGDLDIGLKQGAAAYLNNVQSDAPPFNLSASGSTVRVMNSGIATGLHNAGEFGRIINPYNVTFQNCSFSIVEDPNVVIDDLNIVTDGNNPVEIQTRRNARGLYNLLIPNDPENVQHLEFVNCCFRPDGVPLDEGLRRINRQQLSKFVAIYGMSSSKSNRLVVTGCHIHEDFDQGLHVTGGEIFVSESTFNSKLALSLNSANSLGIFFNASLDGLTINSREYLHFNVFRHSATPASHVRQSRLFMFGQEPTNQNNVSEDLYPEIVYSAIGTGGIKPSDPNQVVFIGCRNILAERLPDEFIGREAFGIDNNLNLAGLRFGFDSGVRGDMWLRSFERTFERWLSINFEVIGTTTSLDVGERNQQIASIWGMLNRTQG